MTEQEELEQLRAELEALKAEKAAGMKIKIGNKQNVSVYGLAQRFPVTLYAPGWQILIDNIDKVQEFIDEHKDELSWERS